MTSATHSESKDGIFGKDLRRRRLKIPLPAILGESQMLLPCTGGITMIYSINIYLTISPLFEYLFMEVCTHIYICIDVCIHTHTYVFMNDHHH